MTTSTVRRRMFVGDWPLGYPTGGGYGAEHRPGGVGPARTDDLCTACDKPVSTTGECGCSA